MIGTEAMLITKFEIVLCVRLRLVESGSIFVKILQWLLGSDDRLSNKNYSLWLMKQDLSSLHNTWGQIFYDLSWLSIKSELIQKAHRHDDWIVKFMIMIEHWLSVQCTENTLKPRHGFTHILSTFHILLPVLVTWSNIDRESRFDVGMSR